MNDLGWTQYHTSEEYTNTTACIETAKKNGYSEHDALNCDDAELNCPACPFRR